MDKLIPIQIVLGVIILGFIMKLIDINDRMTAAKRTDTLVAPSPRLSG